MGSPAHVSWATKTLSHRRRSVDESPGSSSRFPLVGLPLYREITSYVLFGHRIPAPRLILLVRKMKIGGEKNLMLVVESVGVSAYRQDVICLCGTGSPVTRPDRRLFPCTVLGLGAAALTARTCPGFLYSRNTNFQFRVREARRQ